jgi:hypothetical protein
MQAQAGAGLDLLRDLVVEQLPAAIEVAKRGQVARPVVERAQHGREHRHRAGEERDPGFLDLVEHGVGVELGVQDHGGAG